MIQSFSTGFFLGLSLIMAIGAQNTFVLRQGVLGQHVFFVALFCALSDVLHLSIGVIGISFFFNNCISQNLNILFGFSSFWLFCYGIIRLKSAFRSNQVISIEASTSKGLLPTISIAAILTFLNPHVYLDTMILIGSISQQFSGYYKITFALGASLASFVFFFCLAYGAKFLEPLMKRSVSWRILDCFIAFFMFIIAYELAITGNWL